MMKRSTGEHLGHGTISIGVATLHNTDTVASLIERTDACLYAAKRHAGSLRRRRGARRTASRRQMASKVA